MEDLLRAKGLKVTPARLAILNTFQVARKPLSAEGVFQVISRHKKYAGINEATVYRTLLSFTKAGILRRIDLRKDSVYFELCHEHHHHITCVSCGAMEDFANGLVEKALHGVIRNSSSFTKIQDHSLELFGFCKKCS